LTSPASEARSEAKPSEAGGAGHAGAVPGKAGSLRASLA
jgi:hypothetical protein